MKKLFLVLSLMIFSVAVTQAQVELKALVGTNFTTLTNLDHDVSAQAGYQFGGGVLFGDKFYVEPGLQIVKTSKTFETTAGDIDFTQNFVKVPVYAGYHLFGHESGPLALRVFAGPAVSVAGKIGGGEHGITKDDVKNALWSFDVGAGLDILFLFVEVNYEYAMTDYFTAEIFDSKRKSFLINAGIHIDF